MSAVGRLKRVLRRQGLLGTAWLAARLSFWWVRRVPVRLRERSFDRRYGIDTQGIVRPDRTGLLDDAVRYQGTPESVFREIVARLPVDTSQLSFLDVGCGKGRTLILAAELGFRRVLGVEISPELARTARENLELRGVTAEVQVADAAEMSWPEEPLLVYLYNPFGRETTRTVVERLRRSVSERPRPVVIVYVTPRYRDLLDGAEVLAEGRDWLSVAIGEPATLRPRS